MLQSVGQSKEESTHQNLAVSQTFLESFEGHSWEQILRAVLVKCGYSLIRSSQANPSVQKLFFGWGL